MEDARINLQNLFGDPRIQIHPSSQPILAFDSRLRHTSVPFEHRNHALLRNQFYFTLPTELLDAVITRVGREAFDSEVLELDGELSGLSDQHDQRVGFWRDMPVMYNLLSYRELETPTGERTEEIGWELNDAQIASSCRVGNERLSRSSTVARGFAGWLMSNSQFVDEHDQLMTKWSRQVCDWGTHLVGVPRLDYLDDGIFNPTNQPGWDEFAREFSQLFARWRLQSLAAPCLPVPFKPHTSDGNFPFEFLEGLLRSGGMLLWPDTFPVPSRDELRSLLEDAMQKRRRDDEHLGGWFEIIASGNTAKNRIAPLARTLVLQHHWRTLVRRYPSVIDGNKERLRLAFAQFLGVSDAQVKADLKLIQNRLGANWTERGVQPRIQNEATYSLLSDTFDAPHQGS